MAVIERAIAEQKKSQTHTDRLENSQREASADEVSIKSRRKHRRGRRSLERQGRQGHIKKT